MTATSETHAGTPGHHRVLLWLLVGCALAAIAVGATGAWAALTSLDGTREELVLGWNHGGAWVLLGSLLIAAALLTRVWLVATGLCVTVGIFASTVMYQLPGTMLDSNPDMFLAELAWGAWLVGAGITLLAVLIAWDWRRAARLSACGDDRRRVSRINQQV